MRDLHQPHPRVAGWRASLFALVLSAAAPWPAMAAADDPAYVDGAAGQAAPDPANADQRRPAPPPMADAGQQAQAIPIADADAAGLPMTPEARYLMQQQMQAAAGAAETGAAPTPGQPAAADNGDRQVPPGEAVPMDANAAPAGGLARAIGAGLAQDAARAVSARMQREILGERHGARILVDPVDPREMPPELPPARAEAGWPGEE